MRKKCLTAVKLGIISGVTTLLLSGGAALLPALEVSAAELNSNLYFVDENGEKVVIEDTDGDNIVWMYKTIDGITFKRQYNLSTHEWIGSWIPV